ncbi:hypothetical protein [Marinobacter caseinilyticus]|uniref:hypothetical protein n=1 Tax=Marinobacter caseinilyticus TaxID=2692195 RepID=UPI00140B3E4B|nr:hypothetical protein [Marinobacter caseinilyticus]
MRAELSLSVLARYCLVIAASWGVASLSGCKTKKDPDQPTILGQPAANAYLGVEYYYNFGAYGGEDVLDYSLTKAPSWLALEAINNNARQGIIMRGIPGITGGNRGRSDLGKTENVTLLGTDGTLVGLRPFDVDVKENVLSLSADESFREGTSAAQKPDKAGQIRTCQLPEDIGITETEAKARIESGEEEPPRIQGEHTYLADQYNDDGSVSGVVTRTKPTNPVLVRVLLDQPSVTKVKVAFELLSDFDPTECDAGANIAPPHQKCANGFENRDKAIIGQDIVGLGSNSASQLPVPDYLEYLPDDNNNLTRGVITLEPGITECFIRLEVVDDDSPEKLESYRLELTDVREGLAALGAGNTVVRQTMSIVDNEVSVVFETPDGAQTDVINAGEIRPYVAKLIGREDNGASYRVRLKDGTGTTAVPVEDFEILEKINEPDLPGPEDDVYQSIEELVFAEASVGDTPVAAENEVTFYLSAQNGSALPLDADKVIVVAVDQRYQDGRDFYAAQADGGLRVSINEFTTESVIQSQDGFIPTDMTFAANGQLVVAGIDVSGGPDVPANSPVLLAYDRQGQLADAYLIAGTTTDLINPPVLSYSERAIDGDDSTVIVRELIVAFGTEDALPAAANAGGIDSIAALFRYDSSVAGYARIWQFQSGTAGDDIPRAVALDRFGHVFIGGETSGAWPESTSAGDLDSYVQRIDTELSEDNLLPALAWTRQVGSGLADKVHSLDPQSTGVFLIGSSRGAVAGEPQLGGEDYFFYNASSATEAITVRQRGTNAEDLVTDALLADGQIWIAVKPDEYRRFGIVSRFSVNDLTLRSQRLNSAAASILNYSIPAVLSGALTLNDIDDNAQDGFSTVTAFESDIISAGFTEGDFVANDAVASNGSHAIIARVGRQVRETPDAEATFSDELVEVPGLEELWRTQSEKPGSRVIALTQYRNEKFIALIEQDQPDGQLWYLSVFSGSGRLLNP